MLLASSTLIRSTLDFFLIAWLIACILFDLCMREVPAILTVPPLILAAIWRLIHGDWKIVLVVAALVVISDFPLAPVRIPLACLASFLAYIVGDPPISLSVLFAILVVWVMWELGATGGADAKIIIALFLFFGDGRLLVPILLAGGVQGLGGWITQKKTIPYTVAITFGTAAWLWLNAGYK